MWTPSDSLSNINKFIFVLPLTAAVWSLNLANSFCILRFQRMTLLSFPPEASKFESKLHLSPQISYLCPSSLKMRLSF